MTVVFLPSAVLFAPFYAASDGGQHERQGELAGWIAGSSERAIPMFLQEQTVDHEARASHRSCFDRNQRINVCSPF